MEGGRARDARVYNIIRGTLLLSCNKHLTAYYTNKVITYLPYTYTVRMESVRFEKDTRSSLFD